jgi:2-hydroxyacyl-CoA lyase 1
MLIRFNTIVPGMFLYDLPGMLWIGSGPSVGHNPTATMNLLLVSGSSVQADIGKVDFQELDQVEIAKPFAKYAGKAHSIREIPRVVAEAVAARPRGSYVDLPSDVLHEEVSEEQAVELLADLKPYVPIWAREGSRKEFAAGGDGISEAASLLRHAKRPLVVFGKGAAHARAEGAIKSLVESTGIPFLATPRGKGLLPDAHPLSAAAARSVAISEADVALVMGARLNWLLHFGEPPRRCLFFATTSLFS